MSQNNHPDFDFKNWDFLDPKIVSKFKTISEVSQMLHDEQDKLKNAGFVSFKDKQKIQSNINRFKTSLRNMLQGQKENLIDYFDKQVDFVSKRVNVHHLTKMFQQSLNLKDSESSSAFNGSYRPMRKVRRFSEGDLSGYLKEKNMKEQMLSELRTTTEGNETQRDTLSSSEITKRNDYRASNNEFGYGYGYNERESWSNLEGSEPRHSVKGKTLADRKCSIFSKWGHETDTQDESQIFEKKIYDLQEELKIKDNRIVSLKRENKRRMMESKAKRKVRILGKDFVKDSRMRRKNISEKKEKQVDNKENEQNLLNLQNQQNLQNLQNLKTLENENRMLREQLRKANEKNEVVVKGVKDLSQIVLNNEQMMEEMMKNKKDIEKELKKTKELNSVLVGNFTEFKKYVQKTLGDVSSKLAAYVKKEEFYSELAQENEQLRHRCKSLLAKLKEVTQG